MTFNCIPQKTSHIITQYRTIMTKIPVPESLPILNDLAKYEARSMHGQLPVVWDRAEDFQVFDKWGNCWIDFTSTIFVANIGHSNPEIIKALKKQLNQKLIHNYIFPHEIRAKFLKKLIEVTPTYLTRAFLLSSGTEATECAIKLMRIYGQTINPRKLGIISFRGGMHGRTMAAEMLKGDSASSPWIGYRDPNIYHFPFPCSQKSNFLKDIEKLKQQGLKTNTICGFMIESYQGWSAMFYPQSYIKDLYDFAKRYNILITFDDIQGGFGRTGKLFAYQYYDVKPDLVCLGKGLSGGLPLSAVLGKGDIMNLPKISSMSSTHSGNPLCCAAALANLKELYRKNLIEESARKGKILHAYLAELKKRYHIYIFHIYGKGLLAAVVVKNATLANQICEQAMRKGLLLVHTGRESIKIGPPLTIPDDALLEGLDVLNESISEIVGKK